MQPSLSQKKRIISIPFLCSLHSISAIFSEKVKIRKNSQRKVIAFFGGI